MHNSYIPPEVVERVIKRRGKEHIHDDLTPSKTALIVVDMQNAFMPGPVAHAPCEMAPKIMPQINALANAVRETGGVVVWIQTACTKGDILGWSNAREDHAPRARGDAREGAGARLGRLCAASRPRCAARRHLCREAPLLRLHPGLVATSIPCCATLASTRCSSPAR